EESISPLLEGLVAELDGLYDSYEIIAVNDGSRDASQQVLEAAAEHYPQLKIIQFRRNAGQTAALMAGIDHARGDVIVTIDADLRLVDGRKGRRGAGSPPRPPVRQLEIRPHPHLQGAARPRGRKVLLRLPGQTDLRVRRCRGAVHADLGHRLYGHALSEVRR